MNIVKPAICFGFVFVLCVVDTLYADPPDQAKRVELERRLAKLRDKAVKSNPGRKIIQELRDAKVIWGERTTRLREYGDFNTPTVRFDKDGNTRPREVRSAGQITVAKQVHMSRIAFARKLFEADRYVQYWQWRELSDAEKRTIENWKELPAKQRDLLQEKFPAIAKLALYDIRRQIIRYPKYSDDVRMLTTRGELYARLGPASAYLAWSDLARAAALDPKHKNIVRTRALLEQQLRIIQGK